MTIKEAIASLNVDAEHVAFDTAEVDLPEPAKRFIEAVRVVTDALESPRDWTPCAEGMPTRPDGKDIKRDWYIVTLETGMVTLRAYEFNERSPFGYGFHEQNIIPVVAWRELPEPYRADDTTGKVKEDAECKE